MLPSYRSQQCNFKNGSLLQKLLVFLQIHFPVLYKTVLQNNFSYIKITWMRPMIKPTLTSHSLCITYKSLQNVQRVADSDHKPQALANMEQFQNETILNFSRSTVLHAWIDLVLSSHIGITFLKIYKMLSSLNSSYWYISSNEYL